MNYIGFTFKPCSKKADQINFEKSVISDNSGNSRNSGNVGNSVNSGNFEKFGRISSGFS